VHYTVKFKKREVCFNGFFVEIIKIDLIL